MQHRMFHSHVISWFAYIVFCVISLFAVLFFKMFLCLAVFLKYLLKNLILTCVCVFASIPILQLFSPTEVHSAVGLCLALVGPL